MTTDTLTIHPGVAGVVFNSNEEILLHRRRAGRGCAPPSGQMTPGEDVRSALHRELHEETRLRVDVARFVGLYSDPSFQIVRYPSGRKVHFVTSVFACQKAGGSLQGSEEGFDWRWFAQMGCPTVCHRTRATGSTMPSLDVPIRWCGERGCGTCSCEVAPLDPGVFNPRGVRKAPVEGAHGDGALPSCGGLQAPHRAGASGTEAG